MPTENTAEKSIAGKKRVQSKDFRTVVVSSIGAAANDNLAQITFGLEIIDQDSDEEIILEEIRLVMTPRTLKVVQQTLRNLLDGMELAMGEIPLGILPKAQVEKF